MTRHHFMIGTPFAAMLTLLPIAVLDDDPSSRRLLFALAILAAGLTIIAGIAFSAMEHARHDREADELQHDLDSVRRLLLRHLAVCAGQQADKDMTVDELLTRIFDHETTRGS